LAALYVRHSDARNRKLLVEANNSVYLLVPRQETDMGISAIYDAGQPPLSEQSDVNVTAAWRAAVRAILLDGRARGLDGPSPPAATLVPIARELRRRGLPLPADMIEAAEVEAAAGAAVGK
jgi:hypothetical protein